jgi:hypothetical protein
MGTFGPAFGGLIRDSEFIIEKDVKHWRAIYICRESNVSNTILGCYHQQVHSYSVMSGSSEKRRKAQIQVISVSKTIFSLITVTINAIPSLSKPPGG